MHEGSDRIRSRPISIDEPAPTLAPGRVTAPSGGAHLPGDVQARMERSFRMDLSAVRIHEGPEATDRGALAYARGADLHFAPGRYDPHGERGLALLGHELAHVAQHAEGRASGPQAKGAGGDPGLEAEADAMGERAARGEAARPAGAPRLTAVRDPDGAIQRMIDNAAPVDGSDWDTIKRYLFRTLINERKQSFKEAVEEYIATEVTGYDTVRDAWQRIQDALGKEHQELIALGDIRLIRTTINDQKRDVPDHPNKRGIEPDRGLGEEHYGTIPQSRESQQIAYTLRAFLVSDLLDRWKGPYYDKKKRTYINYNTYLNPADNRRTKIDGYWSESFMLAVFVRPDGVVQISHSGFMGTSQSAAFDVLVRSKGYQVVQHGDHAYKNEQRNYKRDTDLTGVTDHQVKQDTKDRKHKVMNWPSTSRGPIEKGNPFGVCAAPQVLESSRSLVGSFPGELTGDKQMALTEVWVASTGSKVAVKDVSETDQRYSGNQDVPSCLTCQHQLRKIMKKLTTLRRNVVNRERVRDEEGFRWELVLAARELSDTVKSRDLQNLLVGPLLPGKKEGETLPSVGEVRLDGALGELDKLVAAYSSSIDTQAKQRTEHPELIEHDDRTGVLAPLGKAEKETRTYHHEALWAKRMVVGGMIQKDVERGPGTGERARTKTGKLLRFDKPGALLEDKDRLDEQARLINAREPRALEAQQAAERSSEERDLAEMAEARDEERVLDEATRHLGKLEYQVKSGYLLQKDAERLGGVLGTQLTAYKEAYEAIHKTKPGDRKELYVHHRELGQAMKSLRDATGELDHLLRVGHERVREQRSEELARDAKRSSDERERSSQQQAQQREREEDSLRRGAKTHAESSSEQREQARKGPDDEHADQLLARAMDLARLYDASLEKMIQRLLHEDTHGIGQQQAPKPLSDHSEEYIG